MSASVALRRDPLAACSALFGSEHLRFYEHESGSFGVACGPCMDAIGIVSRETCLLSSTFSAYIQDAGAIRLWR